MLSYFLPYVSFDVCCAEVTTEGGIEIRLLLLLLLLLLGTLLGCVIFYVIRVFCRLVVLTRLSSTSASD